MDKKIIKYKLKKNKLEEKVIDILNLKKEYYENEIINSNDNEIITKGVENFFQNLKSNQKEHLLIIVFGSYLAGKSTFISHLENYIKIVAKNLIQKYHDDLVKKLNISFNNIDFLKKCNLFSKITIIECDTTVVNKINLLMTDLNIMNLNIININIVPKNQNTLKNKIINKVIIDIKNKSSCFVEFIKNNNIICDEEINIIIDEINLLKIKNGILLDNDFAFLDKSINSYYQYILNLSLSLSNDVNLPFETQKYYL